MRSPAKRSSCARAPAGFDPLFHHGRGTRARRKRARRSFSGSHGGAAAFWGRASMRATVDAPEGAGGREADRPALESPCRGLVAVAHLAPLAEAKAMLHWHARHRFCSNCGAPTDVLPAPAGSATVRPARREHFPRTDPVVIMLAIDGDRWVLGRQSRWVPDRHPVVVPCRLRRAGRDDRGGGAPRNPGRSRRPLWAGGRISGRSRGRSRCR